MKAIETRYKGYRFRSRLEARWAVFFDSIGARWEYEPEGYETEAGRYLPDFFLHFSPRSMCGERWPDGGYWAEVKARPPTFEETDKLTALCVGSGHSGFFLCGPPWDYQTLTIQRTGRPGRLVRYDDELDRSIHWGRFSTNSQTTEFADTDRAVQVARGARFEFGENGSSHRTGNPVHGKLCRCSRCREYSGDAVVVKVFGGVVTPPENKALARLKALDASGHDQHCACDDCTHIRMRTVFGSDWSLT